MRKAGLLLAVSSLPSNYGIGDFGQEAYHFIDLIKQAGAKSWQVLPLNPLGYGNSPYQPYSSNAMDELYISLDALVKQKLIRSVKPFSPNAKKVDYDQVRAFKTPYLKEAFKNFKPGASYADFIAANPWVKNYAIFITLKKHNDLKLWTEWKPEHKSYAKDHKLNLVPFQKEIAYEMFLQFVLYEQWMALKTYANKQGVELIGDMPIYVGIDSDDVWFNQGQFLLDSNGMPTHIAGVPPDYFSKTGQRWGNPLYHWDVMKQDGFKFWLGRLKYIAQLFDVVRIDHFRGFDTYWKIPSSCPTAVEGAWIEAPGYDLFNAITAAYPKLKIIAEDLGDLRPQVLELRDHFKLPGMKIIQFVLELNPERKKLNDLPILKTPNAIAYTGTHDNQTSVGWYEALKPVSKAIVDEYMEKHQYKGKTIADRMVAFTFDTLANDAIIPVQDVLSLGDDARMNRPGTVGSPNWEWKLVDFEALKQELPKLQSQIKSSKRA